MRYTAPEILLGDCPTKKSDIYSLGIVFWQMKNRKYPYNEYDTNEEIIYKVNFMFFLCLDRTQLGKITEQIGLLIYYNTTKTDLTILQCLIVKLNRLQFSTNY